MTEDKPGGQGHSIKQMEIASMRSSLSETVTRENQILERCVAILQEAENIIPSLPPIAGPIEAHHLEAQEKINAILVSEWGNLAMEYLYGSQVPTDDEDIRDMVENQGLNRMATLDTLKERGAMTQRESDTWMTEQLQRTRRFGELLNQWNAIMNAHHYQIFRKDS